MIKLGNIISLFSKWVDVFIYMGSYVGGRWQNGLPVKVQLYGSIQENNGKVLDMLPEGARLNETKVFYSNQSLPIDDIEYNNGQNDIRFIINDKVYRLIKNEKWEDDYSIYLLQLLRSDDAIYEGSGFVTLKDDRLLLQENDGRVIL
ncbi:hypothetical protein EBU24_01005 [bacterium]|nr:hypothetical protein [bacterium]